MIERVPREYAELRIDLSRDALSDLVDVLQAPGLFRSEELENLRNVARNLVDRFDEKLTE